MKIPEIIPITDLRQDAAAVLRKVQGSLDPLVITQRGRAIAVIHSMEAYEKLLHEHELMRLLAVGEPEVTAAEGYAPGDGLGEPSGLPMDPADLDLSDRPDV
jgi:prevent-host-death family protein